MKTFYEVSIRAFPVRIKDIRTGEESDDTVVIDKPRLQAAQLIGESSKEIIERIYQRQGFKVLDIGKPDKRTFIFRLDNMYIELMNRDVNVPMQNLWNLAGGDGR